MKKLYEITYTKKQEDACKKATLLRTFSSLKSAKKYAQDEIKNGIMQGFMVEKIELSN